MTTGYLDSRSALMPAPFLCRLLYNVFLLFLAGKATVVFYLDNVCILSSLAVFFARGEQVGYWEIFVFCGTNLAKSTSIS